MGRHDERPRLQTMLTDAPGLVLRHPRRQLAKVLVLYAVLPLICAAAGAYIAYVLATAALDHRVGALEADLAQRRAAANRANAERDRALEQYRRDLCVLIDRAQPRDREVLELRRRYGCTGGPSPAPSASTSGTAGRNGAAGPSTSTRAPAPAPNPRAGRPGTSGPSGPPGPTAPAPPTPAPPGSVELCLPLVGCVL